MRPPAGVGKLKQSKAKLNKACPTIRDKQLALVEQALACHALMVSVRQEYSATSYAVQAPCCPAPFWALIVLDLNSNQLGLRCMRAVRDILVRAQSPQHFFLTPFPLKLLPPAPPKLPQPVCYRRANGGRMATKSQIQANRRNANLSTGPRTEQGKAVSRMNALQT